MHDLIKTTHPTAATSSLAKDVPAHPFPLDALPGPMQNLAAAISDSFNLDPVSVALPMLTIAGAAIGSTHRAAVTGDLSHPASLWSAVLDDLPPRANRAISLLLEPLLQRQINITHDLHHRYRHYNFDIHDWHNKRLQKPAERDFQPNPKPLHPVTDYRQYLFTDPDFSNLHRYLRRQPRGCLFVPADLSPFFHPANLRFLSLFDAPPYTFDAASSLPSRFVISAFVALTGVLTPASIPSAFQPTRDSRSYPVSYFLLARSTCPLTSVTPAAIDPELKCAWASLLDSLLRLEFQNHDKEPTPRPIPLVPKARPVLASAEKRLLDSAVAEPDPALRAHLLRLIDYIPRLALILQISAASLDLYDRTKKPSHRASLEFIDPYAIASATRIIDFLTKHTRSLYANEPIDPVSKHALEIVSLIQSVGRSITPRQLMRARSEFNTSKKAREYLQHLADKGLGCFLDPKPKGPSLTFQLNPDIDDTNPLSAPKNRDGVSLHPLKSPNLPPHSP